MERVYPRHIYEGIRQQIAISYVKHEFRKLLWRVPEDYWRAIDKNISNWINSPELDIPRDFWNGFHGICMGFKLKIGLIYFVTAENIVWRREKMVVEDLWFGVDLQQTKIVGEGKLPARQVIEFYGDPVNREERKKQLIFTLKLSRNIASGDKHPLIVVQKEKNKELIYSVYDGNRRLAKAILQGKDKIDAFVGRFTEGKEPRNYWIPTSILMDNLFFARQAYDRGDTKLFLSYIAILRDMVNKSESARYELKERALTTQQPFRDDVLRSLGLLS